MTSTASNEGPRGSPGACPDRSIRAGEPDRAGAHRCLRGNPWFALATKSSIECSAAIPRLPGQWTVTSSGLLLDANIHSGLMRPHPEPKVKDWVAAQSTGAQFLSVVSISELEAGLPPWRTPRGSSLQPCLAFLFRGRVLQVTPAIAAPCGRLGGMRCAAGG